LADARSKVRRITIIMLLITVFLNAIVFLAPLSEPAGTVDLGEEGGANIVDQEDQFRDMNGFAKAVYIFGDATCHQKASRSLFINDNQMPVCSRDVGIYLGLTIGTLVFMILPRRFSFWWLAVIIAPLGIDGVVQLLTTYESNNAIRLATGSMYGIIIAVFMLQSINEIYEVRLRLFGPERWLRQRLNIAERPRDYREVQRRAYELRYGIPSAPDRPRRPGSTVKKVRPSDRGRSVDRSEGRHRDKEE